MSVSGGITAPLYEYVFMLSCIEVYHTGKQFAYIDSRRPHAEKVGISAV